MVLADGRIIKPESDQAFRSNDQFTTYTEKRATRETTPEGCNQKIQTVENNKQQFVGLKKKIWRINFWIKRDLKDVSRTFRLLPCPGYCK